MKAIPLLLVTLLVMVLQVAHATDVTLTWTTPTANSDGTKPATFEGFNIYRGTALPLIIGKTPGPIAGSSTKPLSPTTLTYTDKTVPPGTYYYAVTAWHCEATGCTESLPTVTGATTIKVVVPTSNSPGNVTVTVNQVAAPK